MKEDDGPAVKIVMDYLWAHHWPERKTEPEEYPKASKTHRRFGKTLSENDKKIYAEMKNKK